MKKFLVIFISVTFFLFSANLFADTAKAKPAVAVVDLQAKEGVSKDIAAMLSDYLRTQLFNTDRYIMVTRENMEAILKEQNFQQSGCTSQECVVQMGQMLGVSKIFTGTLGAIGSIYLLNIKMLNIETGEIEKAESEKVTGGKEGLLEAIEIIASKMTGSEIEKTLTKIIKDSTPANIPPEPTYIETNKKGYKEYKNKKDGSILIYIPAGEFTMGSNKHGNEKPVHTVYLDGYFISKYEITFEQYDRFCSETGRNKPTDAGWGRGTRPVMNVDWYDAVAYCKWAGMSLPTEAQWEKAARGGESYKYSGSNDLKDVGWYLKNAGTKTYYVGEKKSNEYGIYDMSGNVWEWCSDWYAKRYYKSSPKNNSKGPSSGSYRVRRGGGWFNYAYYCRCAYRYYLKPSVSNAGVGFRTVKIVEK